MVKCGHNRALVQTSWKNSSAKNESSVIIYSPPSWWKGRWTFPAHKIFLEVHSETTDCSNVQTVQLVRCNLSLWKPQDPKIDLKRHLYTLLKFRRDECWQHFSLATIVNILALKGSIQHLFESIRIWGWGWGANAWIIIFGWNCSFKQGVLGYHTGQCEGFSTDPLCRYQGSVSKSHQKRNTAFNLYKLLSSVLSLTLRQCGGEQLVSICTYHSTRPCTLHPGPDWQHHKVHWGGSHS